MDAATTGQVGLGLSAFGALNSAIGGYYSSKSLVSSLNFQAEIAAINARMSESTAQAALLSGQREEQKSRLNTANVKSDQTTAMAANGVDLTSRSAQNVLNTTDYIGEVDAQTINKNAIASAWGYRTQGVSYGNDAVAKRGAAGAISPVAAGASSLLSGAGQVASQWYAYNKNKG